MNYFSKRKQLDSSIDSSIDSSAVPLIKNDSSLESTSALSYGSLRKWYSCSQIQVLNKSYKTKRVSICRSISSNEMENSLQRKLLLKMIDFSAIDPKDYKLDYDFENPIIKITENLQTIENSDENIDCEEDFDNEFKLSANYSNVSSTSVGGSVGGGSSPADISPSDYYSHELSESVEEDNCDDNWETDSNTISCDKTCAPTGAPTSASTNTSSLSISSRPIDSSDSVKRNNSPKSRNIRSNSSDSAIILPFNDSDNENILSLDSGTNKFAFLQKNHSDNCSIMDVKLEYSSYSDVWPQSRKSTSVSCPHLEAPSVVISDHSTNFDEKSDAKSEDQSSNVLALAIESYLTQSPKISLRRDSICSMSSSTSSLSSLGEEDFVEHDFQTSLKLSPISAWRKVRSLVTSPFVQTYKKNRYPWIQLAGHQGNFLSGQTQGTILKKLNGTEEVCFKLIMSDVIKPLVPEYRKTIKINNEYYLELEDLLANFENPSIMDLKMGVRTYLEEELSKARIKPKLRKDMYEKMVAIDPLEPTDEEQDLKAVTKPRYMIWRETISSTASLGFRIEGIKHSDGKAFKDFKRTKTEEQVKNAFLRFIDNHPHYVSLYRNKLIVINETLKLSQFFKSHEIIGSSLLFVHDNKRADIWLIDFAKSFPLPNGVSITHRDEWKVGNHEDGYLIGLESLIRIFSNI